MSTTTGNIVFAPIPMGAEVCTVAPIVNSSLVMMEGMIFQPSTDPSRGWRAPCFSFYIVHQPSGKKLLYDLGVRADYETALQEFWVKMYKQSKTVIVGEIGDILKEGGVDPLSIDTLLMSHEHLDHTGNIGPYKNADIVCGPHTFNNDLKLQADTENRKPKLIDFYTVDTKPIGTYERAYDYFGDGSLWLCHTPGHTKDHMSVLIRVTSSPDATYILLGGDTAHHPCLLCTHHSHFKIVTSFENPYLPEAGPMSLHGDPELATETLNRTKRMEKEENVFPIMAHDYIYWKAWREDKEIMFPGTGLMAWKQKGLKGSREHDPEEYEG